MSIAQVISGVGGITLVILGVLMLLVTQVTDAVIAETPADKESVMYISIGMIALGGLMVAGVVGTKTVNFVRGRRARRSLRRRR